MNEVKFEDFQLKKSKVKNGAVEIDYSINLKSSGAIRHPTVHDVIELPHPDLVSTVESFHDILMQSWGLDPKDEDLSTAITPTGVDLSGKDEMKGVIITGKKAVQSGAVAMNSPRIRLNTSTFGFEEEVSNLLEAHVLEVYRALYENKQAQLSIAFPADNTPDPDAADDK